ncbi:hypothetical protein [Nonomuraea gerenzanensis]|uniref:DUF4149 domain-containing protein n=1 Tax=Nonomuraea gerenzanensis TaxID=93944 RepID=A0A1M4ER35_9ACTN|nr:hypothetical protein [Nonomuraea gerenzanensis]UBU12756.1 hypothetical protein LCN96_52295 [Nonomuraea gerenzanensis]SBP01312.1 hypothetical protein BN4615_P10828 [Nonomuraea gerenzanensis]
MSTTTVVVKAETPPPVVHTAAMLWLAAVAFGAFEAVLMIGSLLYEGAPVLGLLPQAGFRLAVFAGAVFLTLKLKDGANWARWTLAGTLGVFGTLSLVKEPVEWLLAGGSIAEAMAGADALAWAFAASRVLHVLAVLGALVLMFQPRANAYFRSA